LQLGCWGAFSVPANPLAGFKGAILHWRGGEKEGRGSGIGKMRRVVG